MVKHETRRIVWIYIHNIHNIEYTYIHIDMHQIPDGPGFLNHQTVSRGDPSSLICSFAKVAQDKEMMLQRLGWTVRFWNMGVFGGLMS